MDRERIKCGRTFRNFEEISGKKTCLSTGCHKSENGVIILVKIIPPRWAEYMSELFEVHKKGLQCSEALFVGPPIIRENCPQINISSTEIHSSKGISSNTWAFYNQAMDATALKLKKRDFRD